MEAQYSTFPHLFGLFRREGLHDAAQKWLPAARKWLPRPRGDPPKLYIRDSGTCLCDVTRTTSRRAAHSFCASCALWLVRIKRGEDNDMRAWKRVVRRKR
jgi:hypothetical protein